MIFEVRQATIHDYPAIEAFIREAYEDLAPYKASERWRWQFVDNPFAENRSAKPPIWIALHGHRVVGQIGVQRCGLSASGREYAAGWIVDVMILPAYRGLGLGHRLYQGVAESELVLLTLTMAAATRRMAERLGAIELPAMRQWSRLETPSGRDVSRFVAAKTAYRPNWARAARLFAGLGAPRPSRSASARAQVCVTGCRRRALTLSFPSSW